MVDSKDQGARANGGYIRCGSNYGRRQNIRERSDSGMVKEKQRVKLCKSRSGGIVLARRLICGFS